MKTNTCIQGDFHRKYSSSIKSIKIHLANFKFSHKDDPDKDDVYINREQLENKLKGWLTSDDKSGSYLVAGYRGMGKSSLVNHVLERITRQNSAIYERLYGISAVCLFVATVAWLLKMYVWMTVFSVAFVGFAFIVIYNKFRFYREFHAEINRFPNHPHFSLARLRKILSGKDRREKQYNRIKIKVNLGREVMHERDVLCLITNLIRMRYENYVRSGQNKPFWMYGRMLICCVAAALVVRYVIYSTYDKIQGVKDCQKTEFFLKSLWDDFWGLLQELESVFLFKVVCVSIVLYVSLCGAFYLFKKIIARFDKSEKCLMQLRNLSERLSSTISEANGNIPPLANSVFNVSFLGQKRKEIPIANIRDIETELTDIINVLNSSECIEPLRVQFLIVLDELDKVEYKAEKEMGASDSSELVPPDFSTAIDGFSGSMTNSERRRTILHLLANMKLFLTSARAKFIFISGRELYEAFMADLSDREYAISSIFNGVVNVSSFLYPEREQSDISSMTEQYISEILLPRDYLWQKTEENAHKNKVLKREIPSLRWYMQYLTEQVRLHEPEEDFEMRRQEIRHIIMFLRCFTIYLSHVSNGSPKKIVLYFEKYVKRESDVLRLTDWNDTLECGIPLRYVLYFTPTDQQKIGFIFHLTSPIMDVITSNVSNYDDKLLIEASFLVDHLFKFHGRGFSWRNIEQTPELLDVNKTSELRDFITSIFEFMQQVHIGTIMVGLFQFKFHKRISEEISYISRVSDEAAAMFNFTLNETQAVKQHNIKLLNYYMSLSGSAGNDGQRHMYDDVIARIHLTLADLYFQEEDYSRALQEYQSALNHMNRMQTENDAEELQAIIIRISCMLKMGLTSEYCKSYETAYAVYCSIVDAMISVREVSEGKLGLDIVDTWTKDWRVKQPMVVDYGVRRQDDENRCRALQIPETQYEDYRHQIINGIWDDGVVRKDARWNVDYDAAEYSLNFDEMVSGFARNLSPEKSRIITRLSMFEDVRLIYKAILAKLFILEKMNMNGITQSNIDVAVAEFKYLHRTTNVREKFFISADFFNQLGKILFYKNSLSLLPGISCEYKKESLLVALHWWNIDLYAYLDEYCFKVCRPQQTKYRRLDAVSLKREIREGLMDLTVEELENVVPKPDNTATDALANNNITNIICEVINNHNYSKQQSTSNSDSGEPGPLVDKTILCNYIAYVGSQFDRKNDFFFQQIIDCSKHRCEVRKKSWNLPCYACKYYNLSLRILIEEMFVDPGSCSGHSKVFFLLQNSFRKNLRYQRVNHMRLLATNVASMGNTMYSCATRKHISVAVLELIREVLADGRDDPKRDKIKNFIEQNPDLSKLDRAMLYYLVAYRFYNIAHQSKYAGDCLFRILRLLNETVTIINFDKKSDSSESEDRKEIGPELKALEACVPLLTQEKHNLLDLLFTRYVKSLGVQYEAGAHPELSDYKWIFHMNTNEDLGLSRLRIYSELKEMCWLIADLRIKLFNIEAYRMRECPIVRAKWMNQKRDEITRVYFQFRPLGQISDTFYNEIILNYARFRLNKWIQKDMLGIDPLVNQKDSHHYNQKFAVEYLRWLRKYLENPLEKDRLDSRIFQVKDTPADKLKLVEFLLEDSIVCLTEIVYVLTPYNHISSFTNSFVAGVYEQLWEQSKEYETLLLIYDYRRFQETTDIDRILKLWEGAGIQDVDELKSAVVSVSRYIPDDIDLSERYGLLSSQFFMRLRHKIDDRTMRHVISNYAAEMALRYYRLAEMSHSEGMAYKNQIARNYMLNDDLENDTWLFNTTIERFRLHSKYIENHRRRLVNLYKDSRFYRYGSYMGTSALEDEFAGLFESVRFDDALHTNSEL